MVKLKEFKNKIEKEKCDDEVSSDKNPHLVQFYKAKINKKEKDIASLSKTLKKCTLDEKKMAVKERAF